ncbi:polyphosphate kinase 2 [Mesorhizobium sp. J18]|uniref:polyphosphate kinase 2 n=1 Tax=Mesorhizobium sp. J18 TaxID=935263 RepID=UPI00119B93C9|nr:polyphosphate kinase 2 [Mesorhizobium sp. J18]TWG99930.1 polyphosphate kinase 2 [Mesorhizobium sp. J18]
MNKPLEKSSSAEVGPMKMNIDGVEHTFDIDDPRLPEWVEAKVITAGGFPYEKKLKRKEYEESLEKLQIELVKMQTWMQATGARVMALFEGRDAAGKGGTIQRVRKYMNPRTARNVALPKPTEAEAGQWYFQRYVTHFPTRSEFVTFDRSWYNRGVVEPVMGFCTPEQHEQFLAEAPRFEQSIVMDGIHLFKFWLNIGRETQLKRFHDRRHSLLKHWKFSPMDIAGMAKWDDYTKMRDLMIERTHTDYAPWTIVRANDKRRARLAVMRRILVSVPYAGRDTEAIGAEDERIIGSGPDFLD